MECWDQVHIALEDVRQLPAPVVFVCGEKKMGKSALVRYILNRLLGESSIVQCLDCDIGQSMFNPRGCVAVHTFTQPVLVDNFLNLRKPGSCVYVGETNPVKAREKYRKALNYVYRTGHKRTPMVVNSTGYFRNSGIRLLKAAIRLSNPDLVIELQKPLKPGAAEERLGVNHCVFVTAYPLPVQEKRKVLGVSQNAMCELNYFGSALYQPENARKIPLEKLVIFILDSDARSDCLRRLIGTCVGLVATDEFKGSRFRERLKMVNHLPIGVCLGFGIVKEASYDGIYLWSPVSDTEFQKINAIVLGFLGTSMDMFAV